MNTEIIRWLSWLFASIFYAYQYILRVIPNVMLNDIMTDFNMDSLIFGQFAGIYYIGYILMHIPIGLMLDRYGPKNIMSICLLLAIIGLLPIVLTRSPYLIIIGRFILGAGSSGAILGLFKIISIIFKKERFAKMLSLSVTIGLIGAIYGGAPISYLCVKFGYEFVIKILIAIGFVLLLGMYVVIPEYKTIINDTNDIFTNIRDIITNKKIVIICILSGLMVGPLEGFADVWGTEFLSKGYFFSKEKSSYIVSFIFIGMCFGSPILNLIAEKTGLYIKVITASGIVMFLVFLMLICKILNQENMIALFLIVGICSSYQILSVYKASTYAPIHLSSLSTAFANMVIMSFGYLFHTLIGLITEICGVANNSNDALFYSISIIPIGLLIGSIGFLIFSKREV